MTRDRFVLFALVLALLMALAACSSDTEEPESALPIMEQDRLEIETSLAEIAGRWRYGDKAVLYEHEFEYFQSEHTYDGYLEIARVKRMESDTVVDFRVKDVKFFDRDSVSVAVDVVFVGPSSDTTRLPQTWTMFYHRDRWIRPTLSTIQNQFEFEERRRQADSAAAVEEDSEDW